MKFVEYNYDKLSYKNAKERIYSQTVKGSKHLASFKSHIDPAWIAESDKSSANTLGISRYVMSGDMYFNHLCKDRGIDPQLPTDKQSGTVTDLTAIPLNGENLAQLYGLTQYNPSIGDYLSANSVSPIPSLNLKQYLINLQAELGTIPQFRDKAGRLIPLEEVLTKLNTLKSVMQTENLHGASFIRINRYTYYHTSRVEREPELRINTYGNTGKPWYHVAQTPYDVYGGGKSDYVTTDYDIKRRKGISIDSSGPKVVTFNNINYNFNKYVFADLLAMPRFYLSDIKKRIELAEDYDNVQFFEIADDDKEGAYFRAEVYKRMLDTLQSEYRAFNFDNLDNLIGWGGTTNNTTFLFAEPTVFLGMLEDTINEVRLAIARKASLITAAAKDSALGKLLKDAGYLEGLLETENIAKLDRMTITWRINLCSNINGFNDTDEATDKEVVKTLFDEVKDIYNYVDVVFQYANTVVNAAPTNERYIPIAYIPNWKYMRNINSNRKVSGVLSAMTMLENHVHVSKPGWWVSKGRPILIVVVIAVITIALTVGSGGIAGASASQLVAAGLVAAASGAQIAGILTGAKTWMILGENIGYVGMIVTAYQSIGTSSIKEGVMKYLKSNAISFAIKLASFGMDRRHELSMKQIQNNTESLIKETEEIQELDDAISAGEKVQKFVYNDNYNLKYDFDMEYTYNIKYI